jgi:hypothetical protein
MADVIGEIPELIEQGKQFTYENFAEKSPRGYPAVYSADWLVWIHRINVLAEKFDKSPIKTSILDGANTVLIGNADEDFTKAKQSILNGLQAAEKVFGKPDIPASDRIVTLGHNSPQRLGALEKIDGLVKAVRETNEFPGSSEEKEQLLAELSAGRKLLEAVQVRLAALRATLQPALSWLMEKSAGAMLGKAAGALWDYLVGLKWF